MTEIYVDADACPVKQEAIQVAARHGLVVHIVSNGGLRPSPHPLVRHVIVAQGADAADDWIAERIGAGDIAITADIPLASRCLKKDAIVLGPTGKPFTPEGLAIFTKRREANDSGHPIRHGECAPVGFPGEQEGAPFQVIQTPGQITFVYESNHVFTIVHMNQEHPKNLRPSFMGHSIGHWEGDTLVIDTIGYNGEKWLDYLGTPSSTQLHVIERIKKVNVGKVVLENTLTIIDPVMYTRPWDIRRVFMWRPAEQIGEEICEEDNDQVAPRDAVH